LVGESEKVNEYSDERTIRPPAEHISSGKVFKPSRKLLYKEWTAIAIIYLFFWFASVYGFFGLIWLIEVWDHGNSAIWWQNYMANWWTPANTIVLLVLSGVFLPIALGYPFYVRSIEYSVISESGDTMPEIYVKKGLLNITKKHVPFRTITNISSRAGLLDRVFGIGTVEIETAGFSGANQQGPEEKLEGVVFYEEVRDFILRELRRFRAPYTTGTEVVTPDEPVPKLDDSLDDEILSTLREIRDILRKREE
jgi:membrane protein YdbS with pleckstrin-like domain